MLGMLLNSAPAQKSGHHWHNDVEQTHLINASGKLLEQKSFSESVLMVCLQCLEANSLKN